MCLVLQFTPSTTEVIQLWFKTVPVNTKFCLFRSQFPCAIPDSVLHLWNSFAVAANVFGTKD